MDLAAALRIDDAWWPRPQRGSHRHTVGARPADRATWLQPRPPDDILINWRRNTLDREGVRAFAAAPGTEDAARAVLALLQRRTGSDDAAGRRQDVVAEPALTDDARHPLDVAGRLVAEDLCLVDITSAEPVLVAGSVAMPSGWSIDDKLGRTMLHVHEPVPAYAEQIGAASDQLMRKLTDDPGARVAGEGAGRLGSDRIVARVNWTMQAGDALFRPPGTPQPPITTPEEAGRHAHLRVEYQTLRAVTESTVLFTIRTAMEPLDALTDRPENLRQLSLSLHQLPLEQRDYKGMSGFADPVLTWLDGPALP